MTKLVVKKARTDRFVLQFLKDGVGYNLTDCQIYIGGKLVQDPDAEESFRKSIGDGISITDAAGGYFSVELKPEDKEELSDLARYFWETLIILPNGDPISPDDLSGELIVEPAVLAVPE